MIAEQRIAGSINQIDQIITFDVKTEPWDEHIDIVCNKVSEKILATFLNLCDFETSCQIFQIIDYKPIIITNFTGKSCNRSTEPV